jgi:tetratricopeptide (TPR) repeat protein
MGRSMSRWLVWLLVVACFCVCHAAPGDGEGDAGSVDASAKGAGTRAVAGPKWIRDYERGLKKARDEKKDLFLVLTGHGWCGNCELLDREVFQQPEFVYKTAKSFVFVELDFNYGDSAAEKKRESVERDLQKRYLAPGVPTVFLLNADGVPYGIVTGYEAGFGVPKYLALIQEARAARTVRDQKFAAAQAATGHERAELLHAGLQAVAGQLGTFEERGNDPLLTFYPTVVAEIQKLEPADSPARIVYETRRKERDARLAMDESIFQKLKEFDRKRDYKGAIRFLDARLKEPATPAVRWSLQTARHIYLEWDLQYAAALADARALLASGDRSPEDREFLLDRESFNLCNLGRIDEARSRYDERIHNAKLPAKKLRLLGVKAEMISNRPGVSREEGNRAWREYRQAAKPGTNQWLTATWVLGVRLKRDGRYRDALTLFEEFLQATPKDSGILLQAAECNLALGNKEAARSRIHEAEAALPTSSPRQTDIEEVTNGRARIAKLKEQLGQPGK